MTVDDLADIISNLQAEGQGNSEVRIPSQTGGDMPLEDAWVDTDNNTVLME